MIEPNVFPFSLREIVMKAVVFLAPKDSQEPIGTGFLVNMYDQKRENFLWTFLVTNKHVLQITDKDPDGTINAKMFYEQIRIRLTFDERLGWQFMTVPVKDSVYEHTDPRVDLAVIALPGPVPEQYGIPMEIVYGERVQGNIILQEGRDTFTISLLERYPGIERNQPICKFGKIALITNDFWINTGRGEDKEQAWLVDLGTYDGASGSPVLLSPFQVNVKDDGSYEFMVGCMLLGVVKALIDSKFDHTKSLRALTLIEPVTNLQAIFDPIIKNLQGSGYNPRFLPTK